MATRSESPTQQPRKTHARGASDKCRPARREFVAAATALAVLFLGNNLPSALYGAFRTAFSYSPLVQTLLYATAIAVILPGVVIFGSLSDTYGRRAPIIAGLLTFAVGDVLFAAAHGTDLLFGARLAQGLGMGFATAAASAALTDSASGVSEDPVRAQRIAAITTTICITGGLAAGPLIAGVLAQYAPAPLRLSFYVHIAMIAIALLVSLSIPGRPRAGTRRLKLARLTVPDGVRDDFALIAVSGFLAWAVLGVFSAVIASFFGELLNTGNLAVTAGALTLVFVTSAVAQLASHRMRPSTAQLVGLISLACGLILLVIASLDHSAVLAVFAMLGCGAGNGLIFAGNLTAVVRAAAPNERGAAVAVIFLVNYAGLGIPVIGVGIAALSTGLFVAIRAASFVFAVACVLVVPFVIRGRRSAV
jgi:MFS family permease